VPELDRRLLWQAALNYAAQTLPANLSDILSALPA
jgi:hypothetical protein